MQRVAEFEKVSLEQFQSAMQDDFSDYTEEEVETIYNSIKLPERATSGSAGYDFKAPFSFVLKPGTCIKIPTGVRVKIDEGWWLACLPRSSHGFKYQVHLANTCGVIDSDYYYSDNEGHIFVKLVNFGSEKKTLVIQAGDSFIQGIFTPYGLTHSDDVKVSRNGGMGSTGA